MFQAGMDFWRQHIVLANVSHAVGGFGLALVLQRYIGHKSFLPVIVGWTMLGFSIAAHVYAFTH